MKHLKYSINSLNIEPASIDIQVPASRVRAPAKAGIKNHPLTRSSYKVLFYLHSLLLFTCMLTSHYQVKYMSTK